MKKINFRFLAIAFIVLPCLLILPLSANEHCGPSVDAGAGQWTDVWGQASIYNIWYDATKPETINSSGTIYLKNNSEDTSYEYDWVARLEIIGHPPDVKTGSNGRVWIHPGETYNNPQSLSQIVDATGAPRGQDHDVTVTYSLTVHHPVWNNRKDSWQANLCDTFFHVPEND